MPLNPAFENLDKEKKQKIIDACLEEFANKGYEKASTNHMVTQAGISKGLLFHYFGNKKNLYLYLFDIAVDTFIDKYNKYEYALKENSDLFERLTERGLIKMKIAGEEPQMYKLVMEAFIDTPEGMKEEVNERYQRIYNEYMPAFFEGIDYSLFREGVDTRKAIEFMMLCLDAILGKYTKMIQGKATQMSLEEVSEAVKDAYDYYDMIRFGIYKKEADKGEGL